jgi:hypothetical protein
MGTVIWKATRLYVVVSLFVLFLGVTIIFNSSWFWRSGIADAIVYALANFNLLDYHSHIADITRI